MSTIARKLKAREKFTVNIRPQLKISIERGSYPGFSGYVLVVKGPDAHYWCHGVSHAAHKTSEILRNYDRLVREKKLRHEMSVFDTIGEG